LSLKGWAGIDHQAMVIEMNKVKHVTLTQVRPFLAGTADVGFRVQGENAQRYRWISAVLGRFGYRGLNRAERGVILRYLQRMTGYSRQQVTRLVRQYVHTGGLRPGYPSPVIHCRGRQPVTCGVRAHRRPRLLPAAQMLQPLSYLLRSFFLLRHVALLRLESDTSADFPGNQQNAEDRVTLPCFDVHQSLSGHKA
jgi:hypothetical protein